MTAGSKPAMDEIKNRLVKINLQQGAYFLMSLHAVLFIGFYFSLSYYNRLGRDELLMIYYLNNIGLVDTIKHYYLTAEGNFTSNIIYCIVFQWIKDFKSIIAFHVLFLSLLYLSIYFLLARLNEIKVIAINTVEKLLLPAMILSPSFFFNPIINEAWFWPTAMVVYQVPFIILFFGLYFLLSPSPVSKATAFLFFIFLGGTKINYVLMLGTIGVLYFSYIALFQKKISRNLLIVLAGLLLGLTIYLISPSNMLRMKNEATEKNMLTFYNSIIYNSRYIMVDFLSPLRLLHIALFLAPFLIMDIKILTNKLKKNIIFGGTLIIALNIFLIIENGFIYYLATGKGVIYPRVWTFNFFVLVITISCFVFLAGMFFREKINSMKYNLMVAVLLLYPLISYTRAFSKEYSKAKNLASAYDKRAHLLESYKGKDVPGGVLYLEPLGEPGLINCVELDSDPEFRDNKQVALRYGLNCGISVKNKKW